MKATYVIYGQGNLAVQQEKWTVPMGVAKSLMAHMKKEGLVKPGTYWEDNFARPYRRAVRGKKTEVTVYTAGFSTCNFAGLLGQVGCGTEFAGCK